MLRERRFAGSDLGVRLRERISEFNSGAGRNAE
jgi:hypothetical protein